MVSWINWSAQKGRLESKIDYAGSERTPHIIRHGQLGYCRIIGLWAYAAAFHAIDALNALYASFDGPLQGPISFGGSQDGEIYILDSASIPR